MLYNVTVDCDCCTPRIGTWRSRRLSVLCPWARLVRCPAIFVVGGVSPRGQLLLQSVHPWKSSKVSWLILTLLFRHGKVGTGQNTFSVLIQTADLWISRAGRRVVWFCWELEVQARVGQRGSSGWVWRWPLQGENIHLLWCRSVQAPVWGGRKVLPPKGPSECLWARLYGCLFCSGSRAAELIAVSSPIASCAPHVPGKVGVQSSCVTSVVACHIRVSR